MRTAELDIERARLAVLRYAADRALDSEVLIAALADVLGITAAVLDRQQGCVPFDDRMDAVIERARQRYRITAGAPARQHAAAGPL